MFGRKKEPEPSTVVKDMKPCTSSPRTDYFPVLHRIQERAKEFAFQHGGPPVAVELGVHTWQEIRVELSWGYLYLLSPDLPTEIESPYGGSIPIIRVNALEHVDFIAGPCHCPRCADPD